MKLLKCKDCSLHWIQASQDKKKVYSNTFSCLIHPQHGRFKKKELYMNELFCLIFLFINSMFLIRDCCIMRIRKPMIDVLPVSISAVLWLQTFDFINGVVRYKIIFISEFKYFLLAGIIGSLHWKLHTMVANFWLNNSKTGAVSFWSIRWLRGNFTAMTWHQASYFRHFQLLC